MSTRRMLVLLTLLAGTATAVFADDHDHGPAPVQQKKPAGFDADSGRDTRTYPPHRVVDFTHMRLEITIPDMNVPRFSAIETLAFEPIADEAARLELDAKGLHVSKVRIGDHAAAYTHDGARLAITLDPPVPAGQGTEVVIEYDVNDPPYGLIWTPESPAWPGRAAQLHSQGEAETNSFWFACHDFPNDRLTTEILATVPAGYQVCSNGRLVEHAKTIRAIDSADRADLRPYETYHWAQEEPHVNYLVSLVVGKFDVVNVGTKELPMPVYVPPGRGKDVAGTFGRTPEMAAFFAEKLDEPYPWPKYAQVLVWNFGWGGMENTSATTLYDTAVNDPAAQADHDQDGLISHELAHQWFGDLITCNSWEHIWLNEGFATYLTALWREHHEGRDAYTRQIIDDFDGIIANDRAEAPAAVGMVSNAYADPWDTFRKPANPYGKGSSVLHMLRTRLGDGPFFAGLRAYINEHKFQTVETDDFRHALEAASGESLEQFFLQWTRRPGVPHADVGIVWDGAANMLRVSLEQSQPINAENPAFEFDLPIRIIDTAGAAVTPVLEVHGRRASMEIPLAAEPVMVAVDPDLSVMGAWTISQGEPRWLAQLKQGPTTAARVQAARALSDPSGSGAGAEALRTIALRAGEPVVLRIECVKSLAARGSDGDLRGVPSGAPDSWEVREAATDRLAAIWKKSSNDEVREGVASSLGWLAENDRSLKVRAAALRGLGELKAGASLVQAALLSTSQSDTLRQAGLRALGSFDSAAALALAAPYTQPEHLSRTRAVAIEVVGAMAKRDMPAATKVLIPLLDDRDNRVRTAAGDALVAAGNPAALAEFERLKAASRAEARIRQLDNWIAALREKSKP